MSTSSSGPGYLKLRFSTDDRRAVQLLALLEADVRVLARRGPDLLDLDLLQLLLAGGGLARLGGVRGKAAHELLQVRDPVLGLGIRRFDPLACLHRGQHEIVVVAGIDLQLLEIEIGDVRAHLIQEMPVVADDDHGGVVVVERPFEPADRVDVEIVGRLIEQQHVRPREQRLRQQHAQFQARGHLAHRSVVARLGNAGIGEDAARARLGIVAAVLREHAFELRRLHVILVGGVRIGIDAVALLHRLPQLRVAAASPHRAPARPRRRTGSGSACRAASPPAAPHRRRSARARRRESSSASICRSRSRRSAHSGCRRRT